MSFERPYGLAWLLQLAAELREWNDARGAGVVAGARAAGARGGGAAVGVAAEAVAADSHRRARPDRVRVRAGARLGARARGTRRCSKLLAGARRGLLRRRIASCPLAYEPSGEDFLSPCLAEADLMRRVLPQAEYATWLRGVPAGHSGDGGQAVARARGGDGSIRSEARAPRRAQPVARVDAGGDRVGACRRRTRACPRCTAAAHAHRDAGLDVGHRRALRGRALARQLRGVPGHLREGK